jgi:hypothetical protein
MMRTKVSYHVEDGFSGQINLNKNLKQQTIEHLLERASEFFDEKTDQYNYSVTRHDFAATLRTSMRAKTPRTVENAIRKGLFNFAVPISLFTDAPISVDLTVLGPIAQPDYNAIFYPRRTEAQSEAYLKLSNFILEISNGGFPILSERYKSRQDVLLALHYEIQNIEPGVGSGIYQSLSRNEPYEEGTYDDCFKLMGKALIRSIVTDLITEMQKSPEDFLEAHGYLNKTMKIHSWFSDEDYCSKCIEDNDQETLRAQLLAEGFDVGSLPIVT